VEENEERRREGDKGMRGRCVLFQRAQSRKPAELARTLETTVSSSVVSPCLFFSSFLPLVVLINQRFVTRCKPAFIPILLALLFARKKAWIAKSCQNKKLSQLLFVKKNKET